MKKAGILAITLLLATGAFAQGTYNLGDVTVYEAGYSYGVNDFSRSAAFFSGDALDFTAGVNAADVLSAVPGIEFENSGLLGFGAGQYAGSVTKIRGMGGGANSGILMLVDDRPQFATVFRHPLFDTIALDDVDSIEVIKGPNSVENGNMANSGVIKVRTKKLAQDGAKTVIKSSMGSYLTQNYFLNNSMKTGTYDYSVSTGYKSTAGFLPNSLANQQNYSVKSGYAYNKEIRYSANVSYDNAEYFNPGPEGASWVRGQEGVKMSHTAWDIRAEKISEEFKGKLMFYSDFGSNDFMISTGPSGVTQPGSDISYANFGIRFMEEWNIIPGNVIKIGLDWHNFGGTFKNYPYIPAQQKNVTRHENDYAPYFIIAQKVGISSLMLGFRYAYNDQWGHEFIPQAGYTFSLYNGNKIYISVSKGYSTPAMSTVIFSGETDLRPEDIWQYEAGIEQEFSDFLDISVLAYQTEAQNTLRYDPYELKWKNNGFTLIRGVEADLAVRIKDFMKLGGNIAYYEPGIKSADTSLLTAESCLSFSLWKNLGLRVEAVFAKNRYAADYKKDKLGDYMVLNASADLKTDFLGRGGGFFVEAENLLNTKYYVKKGYPAAGFIIKGGILIKI